MAEADQHDQVHPVRRVVSLRPARPGTGVLVESELVTGYHTEIVVNEHTNGDYINLASNINGLEFVFAYHVRRFGRVVRDHNAHDITVSGKHGFLIEQLNTESPQPKQRDFTDNTAWQKLFSDVNHPKNLAVAQMTYWCCQWGVGVVESFHPIGAARSGSGGSDRPWWTPARTGNPNSHR